MATQSLAFNLPDSDQRKCYQAVSPYAEIPCAGTGQDGAYSINPLNYTDNGDGTVTDNNTGLMWQKQDDGLYYDWYTASSVCGSLTTGSHTDWRLPTKKELMSIVDYAIPYPGPTIKSTYFPNTKASVNPDYWSSTSSASSPDLEAWYVSFDNGNVSCLGNVSSNYKYNTNYVRCVRGGQTPGPTLQNNGDGTVTDSRTGLVWQQGELATSGRKTWGSALSYCEGLNLGSKSDWRLPNVKELESLTDDTRDHPAIDTSMFPNAHDSSYWSSTTMALTSYSSYPNQAWHVYFGLGYANYYDKSYTAYVRCVRGGRSLSFSVLTVTSTNPTSGVTITVSPNDTGGQGNGTTLFTRTYTSGIQVTLTALLTAGGNPFSSWIGCTSTSGASCYVTMDAAKTVRAYYRNLSITAPVPNDFDGDGRSDIGCYYPTGGNWYEFRSKDGFWQTTFGYAGTVPITGDFDGDGKADIGCYYAKGGNWYVYKSTEGFWQTTFGYAGTIPIVGDFDGDGRDDIGCYYPAGGNWYVYKSSEGFWQTTFGYAGTIPIVGDFDGDGRDDIGCYYATGGNWYVYKSSEGFWQTTFGYDGTIPVVGDFDGDGKDDIGCYYATGGNWYVYKSTEGFWQTTFGYAGTEPVVGDFDGDGRDDIGCYYPTGGNWYLYKSTEGFWQTQFGYSGTTPLGGTLR